MAKRSAAKSNSPIHDRSRSGSPVVINGHPFLPADVERVARGAAAVRLSKEALGALANSRRRLESVLDDGEAHYGINTGFGSFSRQRISTNDLESLQRNLVRSHAAGVGRLLDRDVVRGMMLLLAGSLSRGLSGVRPVVAKTIVDVLNAGITPEVPETGSVGASGDLAPLAHVALVLIGEGWADVGGKRLPGEKALANAGIKPLTLGAKEGLALINGTHLMATQGALFVRDFERLFDAALVAAAMSIDACRATDAFLDIRVHQAREQLGQAVVAARLRGMIEGSTIVPSHTLNDPRVQDPYSLRCAPQVLGAAWEAFHYVASCVDAELGAVTDNPLVFEGREGGQAGTGVDIVSAGNFHGMPLAIPLDVAAIACAHVAGISERRVYHMLSAFDPEAGLPPYLSPSPGLHSGLMIAQYTAAACCNEIITLSTPASVSNISTSAGMEDYNSFGPRSAAKARRALELARQVVAIELLCACEAIEHHRPLKSGKAVEAAHAKIRRPVPKLTADRPPAPDIRLIEHLIAIGAFASE
jgi:histidine ammonia-lyase